ncbi:MAG: ribonuclease H-like domain-containing protein, partial [Calditrichota bacterium]
DCASVLVTFNGKSFDLNLLETRFLLHGQANPFTEIPHLDLLHPCRNLWNLDLENCRLQTLEREILHFFREDDTPGEEIPGIYFDFLRTGDPTGIAEVFEHNVYDIVSMVGVTMMLEQNYQGIRPIPGESGLTMFSRGKMHERLGDGNVALECYESALRADLSSNRRSQLLSRMAGLHKKSEQWEQAVALWEQQISIAGVFRLEPYEELAKYYEHQCRDYARAMDYVTSALALLPEHREKDRTALGYRLKRLQRKTEAVE